MNHIIGKKSASGRVKVVVVMLLSKKTNFQLENNSLHMQKILETLRISIVKNLFTGRDKEIIGVNSSCCRNGRHLIIIAGILTLEKHSKSLASSFLLLKWLWVNRVETSVWHQSDSFFNKSLSLVLTRCHTNHLSEAFSFVLF